MKKVWSNHVFPYQCCLTEKTLSNNSSVRKGYDRVVVRFTSSDTINAFHHYSCEFGSRTGQVVFDITSIFSSFAIGDPFSRRGHGIRLADFTPPLFCSCLNPGPGFPTSCVIVFLCSLSWSERCFVDIGGMFDHHRLNLFFITILPSLTAVSLTYQTGRPNIAVHSDTKHQ